MNHNIKENTPIRQHFIPKSYQSLFTTPDKKLYVYDVKNSKKYISQPSNENCENNFQTLTEYEGLDPYILEKEFEKTIEGPAVKIIKSIIKTKNLPPIDELSYVLSFAALTGCRNGSMKQLFIECLDQILKKMMLDSLKNDPTCNQIIDEADLQENYHIKHSDEDEVIMMMIKLTSSITDSLLQKNWMLVETNTSNFSFSNLPLKIVGFNDNSQKNSITFFPLSSKFALIGTYSKLAPYRLINDEDTACINHFVAVNASKIYSNQEIMISNKTKSDLYPFLKKIIC